jgi:Right handed beta helix region
MSGFNNPIGGGPVISVIEIAPGQWFRIALEDGSVTFSRGTSGSGPWTSFGSISPGYLDVTTVAGALLQAQPSFAIGDKLLWLAPSGDISGATDSANIARVFMLGFTALSLQPGQFYINHAISVPAGGSLSGAPGAPDKNSGAMPTRIELVSSSNSHMISLGGRHCYVSDLELNGNKAGQSSGLGGGVLAALGADWSILQRLFIHDQYFRGIVIAGGSGNLQAIKILDCSVVENNDAGIYLDSYTSDVTIRGCLVGSNGSHNIYNAGYVMHILDCDVYSSSISGIVCDWPGSGTMITNCGIDRNAQHGILILTSDVSVVACTLHSNSQETTNTYGSVTLDDTLNPTAGVAIQGCNFWLDADISNLVAYHILYNHTAAAKTHGNGFASGSYGTGTINAASLAKDTNETG